MTDQLGRSPFTIPNVFIGVTAVVAATLAYERGVMSANQYWLIIGATIPTFTFQIFGIAAVRLYEFLNGVSRNANV